MRTYFNVDGIDKLRRVTGFPPFYRDMRHLNGVTYHHCAPLKAIEIGFFQNPGPRRAVRTSLARAAAF
jgi:hypothetical protein